MNGLKLLATGRCLPKTAVSNEEMSRWVDTSDEWIASRTGIRQRYFCGEGETALTLAAGAARQALARSGIDPAGLGCVLCATVSPDYATPSLACLVQAELGLPEDIPVQRVLLQVNIGNEPQKAGVDEHDLPALAEAVLALPRLEVRGLMCLPPFFDDGEAARPYFARLRELRDDLEARLGIKLPELSMGMSGDCVQAVEEGATLVRVGTDIFGPRPVKA